MAEKTKKKAIKITEKEKERIRAKFQEMLKVYDDKRRPILTPEDNQDIYIAAHSKDDNLYAMAATLVYFYVLPQERKKAKEKFAKGDPYNELDDYINGELYQVIYENLGKYEQGRGVDGRDTEVSTFVNLWVTQKFVKLRSSHNGLSPHYNSMKILMDRAEKELSAQGFMDVSDVDLAKYILIRYKTDISMAAITTIRDYQKKMQSIDATPGTIEDQYSPDPEAYVIEQERKRETFESIGKIKNTICREFIKAELIFCNEYDTMPTDEQILQICRKLVPNCSKTDAIRIREAAHNAFGKEVAHRRRQKEEPINGIRLVSDESFWNMETGNIIDAIAGGDDIFDEPVFYKYNMRNIEDEIFVDDDFIEE